MKLVLTVLLRDEEDILDAQIAYHLAAGVDFIIATDHRSTDASPEILARYVREGYVHVIREESERMDQPAWVTRMARLAATDFGADWVINSDADEFWWPCGGSLKDVLAAVPREYGALGALIRTFVPRPEDERPFYERMTARLAPQAPINDPTSMYRPVPKYVHRADPDVLVGRGSHTVRLRGLRILSCWYPVEVLHFPVRSIDQIRPKARFQIEAFSGQGSRAETAYHAKAFAALQSDRIAGYYASLALDEIALAHGLAGGSVVVDERLCWALRSLRAESRGFRPAGELAATLEFRQSDVRERVAVAVEAAGLEEAELVRARRTLDELEQRLGDLQTSGRRSGT